MSKEKRDKLILVCLMIAGVLGALYTFVLGNQKDKLNGYRNGILTMKDRLSKAESLLRRGPFVEEQLLGNQKILAEMQEHMSPPGDEVYHLGKLLQEFGSEQRLDPSFIDHWLQPQFVDAGLLPKFPYRAVYFPVRTSGHFHDTGKFISQFENRFPYMRIEQLELRPDTRSRSGGRGRAGQGAFFSEQSGVEEPVATEKLIGEFRIVNFIRPNPST